jgi:hypothetical protein
VVDLPAKPPEARTESTTKRRRCSFRTLRAQWRRPWILVSDEKDADFLLLFYQSGTSSLGGDQLTLAAVSKTGRKMLSVNCERRMSSGYTAGVLVNRMKKRLADAAREQK